MSRRLVLAGTAMLLAFGAAAPAQAQSIAARAPVKSTLATRPAAVPPAHAEVNMVELQSLAGNRANTVQMATGMANSIDASTKTVAGNIGGGSGPAPACKPCTRKAAVRR